MVGGLEKLIKKIFREQNDSFDLYITNPKEKKSF